MGGKRSNVTKASPSIGLQRLQGLADVSRNKVTHSIEFLSARMEASVISLVECAALEFLSRIPLFAESNQPSCTFKVRPS